MKKYKFKSIFKVFLCFVLACCSFCLVSCKDDDDSGGTSTGKLTTVSVSTYEELKSAVNGSADIVKLTKDIDIRRENMNDKEFFVFDRKLTLDLNEHKIYCTQNITNKSNGNDAMLEINGNGNVTIKGNGKVFANENDALAVQVSNGGKLIIESGEFVGNRTCIYVHFGSVEIKGGKFRILQKEQSNTFDMATQLYGYGFLLDFYKGNIQNCSISVSGGEFENFNPANNISGGVGTNYLKTGYKSVLDENSTSTKKNYIVSINK